MSRPPSVTQLAILRNVKAGRRSDYGRPAGMSGAGGWDSSLRSCHRHGWLDVKGNLSAAGIELLEGTES